MRSTNEVTLGDQSLTLACEGREMSSNANCVPNHILLIELQGYLHSMLLYWPMRCVHWTFHRADTVRSCMAMSAMRWPYGNRAIHVCLHDQVDWDVLKVDVCS